MLNTNNFRILNKVDQVIYTYSEDKNNKNHFSILDHVFADIFSNDDDLEINVRDVSFSDHRALLFRGCLKKKNHKIIKQRTITNYENIKNDLNNVNFENNNK